jgi:NAD dependent epimerase/dehydratase family enzyme
MLIIIHLAELISLKPWTNIGRLLIVEQSTQLIYSVLKKSNKKLDAFISASAVGMEQLMGKKFVLKLRSRDDFLGLTCQKWEAAADQFENWEYVL